jgi:hypothetical protein
MKKGPERGILDQVNVLNSRCGDPPLFDLPYF